ncbi:ribonuclease P protein component [Solimonas sp. K1W22B-7]|uniref:ribonuclease P protein component n=1 Tax=Solimonas sp. K1W22B-7 TaxID=2303331 RepID=UPI000E333624|nr:ribonuclease P protein component [Solimonas sp. K1W22B-7]AXQ31567.1 ribonuclease P protein component [Solimonas sp. K1W22B-7]
MTARFPRRARLQKPGEFKAAFERGSRLNEKWLTALVVSGEDPQSRLGLAVPKKAVPRAVDRNRIKRQIRESYRLRRSALPPLDVVILARGGCLQATPAQLNDVLDRLWTRVVAKCAPSASS